MVDLHIPEESVWGSVAGAIGFVVVGVVGLVKYSINKQVKQIDEHGNRIAALEKDSVTRSELANMENRLCDKMDRGFDRLTDRLDKMLETKHKAS